MKDTDSLRKAIEKALAFAYAAIEEPTTYRILEAKSHADEVLPHVAGLNGRAFTLGEGKQLIDLVAQLRAVLTVLNRRLHPQEQMGAS